VIIRRILLSALVSLLLASSTWAMDSSGPEAIRQAAESGNADAQLEMGILYEFGFYMKGNDVPALAWYLLAAKQGNEKAIQRRDSLMSRMTQAQIEQAQQESMQLLHSPTRTQ
jgi:TPR repeat protein